jgi:hypothetical protein
MFRNLYTSEGYEGGVTSCQATSTCMALRDERARGAELHLHWLLKRDTYFPFEITVEMGADGA